MAQEGFEPSASLVLSESGLPVAYRASEKFRGLESNQRPPRSERGVTTSSNYPGVVDSGRKFRDLHRLIQSQGACQLADSRERPAGVEPDYRTWEARAWPLGPGRYTHYSIPDFRFQNRESERDRGFEPRSPGWKPGVVPLDQSRNSLGSEAEEEGVEPSRLIARPSSSRVPSPIGLSFRFRRMPVPRVHAPWIRAPAGGVEPPIVALTGRRLTVWPHRYCGSGLLLSLSSSILGRCTDKNRDGRI